jgi:hypothetical protein
MITTKSNCCRSEVKVITDTDLGRAGTSYFECSKCGKSCDVMPQTKWEEEFEKNIFGDCFAGGTFCDNKEQSMFTAGYKDGFNIAKILSKQFISDLRKADEEALIKMFDAPQVLTRQSREKLIKDYYKSN